jgi:hypothetical protein
MPITKSNGGTTITGEGITLFTILATISAVKSEGKGFGFKQNRTKLAMQYFGMKGNATAKNRELVLAKLEELKEKSAKDVRKENAALN